MGLGSLFRPVYKNDADIRKMKQKHKPKHKHHTSAQWVFVPIFKKIYVFEYFLNEIVTEKNNYIWQNWLF